MKMCWTDEPWGHIELIFINNNDCRLHSWKHKKYWTNWRGFAGRDWPLSRGRRWLSCARRIRRSATSRPKVRHCPTLPRVPWTKRTTTRWAFSSVVAQLPSPYSKKIIEIKNKKNRRSRRRWRHASLKSSKHPHLYRRTKNVLTKKSWSAFVSPYRVWPTMTASCNVV